MSGDNATTIVAAIIALVMTALPGPASAQEYPSRPIMLTVTYSPGGATDLQARIVSQPAADRDCFGRPMVIVNKPGAGGKVAWTWFASRAQKTGYEVAVYNLPHVLAQSIALDADYGLDTLEPIANFGADPAVLAERLPAMFHDEGVLRRMREGGASMRIMGREEVQTLWQRHQAALEALLADLGE